MSMAILFPDEYRLDLANSKAQKSINLHLFVFVWSALSRSIKSEKKVAITDLNFLSAIIWQNFDDEILMNTTKDLVFLVHYIICL